MAGQSKSVEHARRVEGEVAIVSGGANGIGRATAERLVDEGARVVVADLDEEGAADWLTEHSGSVSFVALDVADPEAWTRTVSRVLDEWGSLTILVNAAGVLTVGGIENTTLEQWHRTMAVNLEGVYFGCRAVIAPMRDAGRGAIVNVASISGLRADSHTPAYDASKAGVRSLTKEVAVYCAQRGYGIRCNSVHPGSVDTAMMQRLAKESPELHRQWIDATRVGRVAAPDEIAAAIAFLASDQASFITGAEFVIDGGTIA